MNVVRSMIIVFACTLIASSTFAQKVISIDDDNVILRDSLGHTLLTDIVRGSQHRDALWMTYNRHPDVDPWSTELRHPLDEEYAKSFIEFWKEQGVTILGILLTFDPCLCFKHRAYNSPDMTLVHFKVSESGLTRMKEQWGFERMKKIN